MAKIKRSEFATYINIVPGGTADYALLGVGIVSANINYNPQVLEETYIHQDSGSREVESYQPDMPLEITPDTADEAADFLDTLRKSRAVLGNAETDIINVWLYEAETSGAYPAEKQNVSVQVDTFGGDGGTAVKGNYTLNYIGDPVAGTFNPTTGAFTAS
jgi:hypothetical protein